MEITHYEREWDYAIKHFNILDTFVLYAKSSIIKTRYNILMSILQKIYITKDSNYNKKLHICYSLMYDEFRFISRNPRNIFLNYTGNNEGNIDNKFIILNKCIKNMFLHIFYKFDYKNEEQYHNEQFMFNLPIEFTQLLNIIRLNDDDLPPQIENNNYITEFIDINGINISEKYLKLKQLFELSVIKIFYNHNNWNLYCDLIIILGKIRSFEPFFMIHHTKQEDNNKIDDIIHKYNYLKIKCTEIITNVRNAVDLKELQNSLASNNIESDSNILSKYNNLKISLEKIFISLKKVTHIYDTRNALLLVMKENNITYDTIVR